MQGARTVLCQRHCFGHFLFWRQKSDGFFVPLQATMGGEAAALMTPAVIERMRTVKIEIERGFM